MIVITFVGHFEELGKENSLYYLEKIFQIEFDLPFIDSMMLRKNLVNLLESRLDEKYSTELKKLYSPNTSSLYYPFLDNYIRTLRDVNRFINLFSFQFNQIQNEVSFSDYFNITLLKMKYPEMVKILYEMREEFFDHSKKDDMDRMHLKISEKETLLTRYLDKNKDKLHLEDNDIQKFDNSIRVIFGEPVTASSADDNWSEFASTFYLDRELNSIVFPNTFYRYFANQIFSVDVSDVEWYECFTFSYNEFNAKLKEWIGQGARKEVYLRLKMIKDFKNRTNFENVIRVIFELASYKVDSDDHPTEAWYNYEDLFSKLYRGDIITNNFYAGNINDYLKFLDQVLRTDKSPYSFTVGFVYHICNEPNYHSNFPITKEELIKINVDYLSRYLTEIDSLNKTAWELFYDCRYVIIQSNSQVIHPIVKEAMQAMIEYFDKKGIEYFINSVVFTIKEDRIVDPLYFISDGPKAVFDNNYDSIKTYVNKFPNSPLIDEFNVFFDKLKESNFGVYIPFEFKLIVINK